MEQPRSIFDAVFFRDLISASLIFVFIAFTPLVGAIVFVFIPLPVLHYYLKHGQVKGFAIVVFSLLISTIALSIMNVPANTALFTLLAGAGIMIAECLKRNWAVEKTVAYPVIAIFILSALFLFYQALLANDTPWQLLKVYIAKQIGYSVNLYTELNIAPDQISFIKDKVPEIAATVTMIFPALFLVALTYMIWVNMLAGRIISKKYGLLAFDFSDLSSWKPPERMVWYFIAAGAVLLLPVAGTEFIAWNVLVVILSLYFLAGLAIVSFFLKKGALPAAFRYLIYFLIFAQQIITLVVVAAGLFDLWVDFRKLKKTMEDSVI